MNKLIMVMAFILMTFAPVLAADKKNPVAENLIKNPEYQTQIVSGWTLHVDSALLVSNQVQTAEAVVLLKSQLDHIVKIIPMSTVTQMRKVSLWFSPIHPGFGSRAEYHPEAKWLKENGRNPAMAQGVEFSNILNFKRETVRMPNFALHELAHSYHDRVLGFDEPRILATYKKALASGKYDHVEVRNGLGKSSYAKSYAMTDHKEYFAECTEGYFSVNDIYPFTNEELKKHDPEMYALVEEIWEQSK